MQMGGARQKHNAEGGREAKKFKNHCHRCCGRSISPCRATVHQIVDFSIYLREKKALSILAMKVYRVALGIISSLRGKKMLDHQVVQLLFQNFE